MLRQLARLAPVVLAFAALTAPSAEAGCSATRYQATGTRTPPGFEFTGFVDFGVECDSFRAEFNFDLMPAVGIPDIRFVGSYDELNLLFVSFWSMDGSGPPAGGTSASGSGIRLFFGLLNFGTIVNNGDSYAFSAGFDSILTLDGAGQAEQQEPARRNVRSSLAFQRLIADRSRTLSPVL